MPSGKILSRKDANLTFLDNVKERPYARRIKVGVRSVTFAFHYSGLENTTYYKYPLDSWVQWMTNYIARRTHLIDMIIEQHHYSTIR